MDGNPIFTGCVHDLSDPRIFPAVEHFPDQTPVGEEELPCGIDPVDPQRVLMAAGLLFHHGSLDGAIPRRGA
jgi:hypothetical protein